MIANPMNLLGRLLMCTCLLALGFGCAGSNANRARSQSEGRLSISDAKQQAYELAEDIMASRQWTRFRNEAADRNEEVMVLLANSSVDDDYTGEFSRKLDLFLEELPKAFEDKGVGEFRFSAQEDLGKEDAKLFAELDAQDADDNFDSRSGDVTTGSAGKAVVVMSVRGRYFSRSKEMSVQVRLLSGVGRKQVYSSSFTMD